MSETTPTDLVYALAHTQSGELCFAARASGLYRSADGGVTWLPAYATLDVAEPIPTTSVAVSPDFESDPSVFSGVSGGIFRSSDGGETWQAAALSSPPPTVSTLVISPNFVEDGILLAGTMEDGVFRSANRGSSWASWNFGLLDLDVLCLAISPDFANDETLFAGVESGVFRSTNGGRAWREIDLPFGYDPVISLELSPNYTQDGTIFVGAESHGLWRSTDRGTNWTRLGKDVIITLVNSIVLSQSFADDPGVLVLGENGLHISRDSGKSWNTWPLDASDITAVAAPHGLHAPLLVGLLGGEIVKFTPPEN